MKLGRLTEYCTINMGQSPNSETYNDKGEGMPFYQGNADFGEMYPRTRVWCSAPMKVACAEDILISVRAPIGAMNIAKEECCIGRGLAALTPKTDKCSQKYLYYALQSKMDSLIAQGTGSTFKAISKKVLEKTTIPMYSLNEQRQIVDVIEKVEYNLSARRKQIYWLEQLVKSRFVELFGKCENMVAINDLCSIITDGTHQPPQFQDKGIPFIFVSNLANNTVTYNAEKFISDATYNELIKRTPIEIGDVLLSTVGSYGHPAVVTENRKFLFQRHIAYMKPKHEMVNSFYLHSALLAPDGQRQIEERVKGIAQKTLNLSEIRKIMIPIPSIEEQNQFEKFIRKVDKSKYCSQKFAALCSELIKIYEQEWMSCQTLRF